MTPIKEYAIIPATEAETEFVFEAVGNPGDRVIIEGDLPPGSEDGDFGGRAVTLGYQGMSGLFRPFKAADGVADVVFEGAFFWEVIVPRSGLLALRVNASVTLIAASAIKVRG